MRWQSHGGEQRFSLDSFRLYNSDRVNCKRAILLGAVVFFSYCYFYEGGGWNQNSRFDLVRALVEQHTLQIDAYHTNTEDKAHFQGHYYSDKAPGVALLAWPFAVAARPALRAVGIDPSSPRGEEIVSYVVTVGAVSLPAALAVVCLFFVGLRLSGDAVGALFGALVLGLGSPIWAYASLLWAHALAGACLIFAFAAAVKLGDDLSSAKLFGWALAVGFAAGWATVTEYPAAPASAVIAFLALSQVWKRGGASRCRAAARVGLGAIVCIAVLMTYLHAAFGSFRPSYSYYDPNAFTFMHRGYLGLTYPHIDVLLKLLFSCKRGLFFAAPAIAAAPIGLYWLGKEKSMRWPTIAAGVIAAYYFLFNASFYEWRSGLSFGPRYAGAGIPLLCVGLPVVWNRVNRCGRYVLTALAAIGISFALMVISTTSQLSEEISCPLLHTAWPAFWSGHLALNQGSMLTVTEAGTSTQYGAFNLGQLIGLHGLASLLPLLAVWVVAGVVFVRMPNEKAIRR